MRIASGTTLLISWLFAGLALAASPALGATRHAAPGGTDVGACPSAAPCDLKTAVEGAISGDVVELAPGTYVENERISALAAIEIRGPEPPARALLESTADYALSMNADESSISWLTIEHSGSFAALYLSGAHADHVFAHSSAGDTSTNACWLAASGEGAVSALEESVCWNSATGKAIISQSLTAAFPTTATVRNVTAVASGSGPGAQAVRVQGGNEATVSLTATGLIASGTAAAGGDVDVWATNGATATAALSYSNYSSTDTHEFSGGTATVTPPSASGNQTTEPLLTDLSDGDFRQAAGSPTIDAGDPGALQSTDLDGKPRPLGAAIDIGAYEADPAVDTTAPIVRLVRRPAKRTRQRRATFRFTAIDDISARKDIRFLCKLNNRAFRSCVSPRVYRGLKPGRHVFRVRAIDEAGNRATLRWVWRVRRR